MMLAHQQGGSLCGSLSKIVDTPLNGRPSLFGMDIVHRISLSHALLVYFGLLILKAQVYAHDYLVQSKYLLGLCYRFKMKRKYIFISFFCKYIRNAHKTPDAI
jgi:hypothetical protein